MRKESKYIIKTEDIIKQAEKFYEVAEYSIGIDYNGGWYVGSSELSDEELSRLLFPKDTITATVNLSFCCELLLKSIINKGDINEGHNLQDLYKEVDSKWQKMIALKMNENVEKLTNSLIHIANVFEKWRYIYECEPEDRKIQFSFLNNFATSLMSVAHAKYYYENNELNKICKNDLLIINSIFD